MSNIIPPLLSSTPPPIVDNFDEDEDDEFGDFRTAGDISIGCDSLSIPPSPDDSPRKGISSVDINSNSQDVAPKNEISSGVSCKDIIKNEVEKSDRTHADVDFIYNHGASLNSQSGDLNGDLTSSKLETSDNFDQYSADQNIISDESNESNSSIDDTEIKNNSNFDSTENNVGNHEHIAVENEFGDFIISSNEDVTRRISNEIGDNSASEFVQSNDNLENIINRVRRKDYTAVENLMENSISRNEKCFTIEGLNTKVSLSETCDGCDKEVISNNSHEGSNFDESNDDFGEFTTGDTIEQNIISDKLVFNFKSAPIPPTIELENLNPNDVEGEKIQTNVCDFSKEICEENSSNFMSCECSQSESMKSNVNFEELPIDKIDDNDDFGDFTSTNFINDKSEPDNLFGNLPEIQSDFRTTQDSGDKSIESETNFEESATHKNDDSDFGDFTSSDVKESLEPNSSRNSPDDLKVPPSGADLQSDDDFGDFTACQESEKIPSVSPEDDFSDFVTSSVEPTNFPSTVFELEDDFDDFAEFSAAPVESSKSIDEEDSFSIPDLNDSNFLDKAVEIFKIAFENAELESNEEYINTDITKDDFVFKSLCDIVETNAASYRWSKSLSQALLLKSLSINEQDAFCNLTSDFNVPKFAANLSSQPLEPIKSDFIKHMVDNKSIPSNLNDTSHNVKDVPRLPSSQFEWNSSSLNPVDYSHTALLDLEQLLGVYSSNSLTNNDSSPVLDELEEWDRWLKSKSTSEQPEHVQKHHYEESEVIVDPKTELSDLVLQSDVVVCIPSKKNTKSAMKEIAPIVFTETYEEKRNVTQKSDNFDFSSFLSTIDDTWTANMVPLRETHISVRNEGDFVQKDDMPEYLEPVVQPVGSLFDDKIVHGNDSIDDFDDYQMSLPIGENKLANDDKIDSHIPFTGSNTCNDTTSISGNFDDNDEEFTDFCASAECTEASVPPIASSSISNFESSQDDEFSDFYSSAPPSKQSQPQFSSSSTILQPLKPVLAPAPAPVEPLKPASIKPQVTPAQINWPNPGIINEDLSSLLEMNYSSKSKNIPKEPALTQQEEKSKLPKEKSVEEDEWTDFVSVQDSKIKLPERTSTPDLPLSVFNLSQIQPVKQPVPLITPQGLMKSSQASSTLSVVQKSISNMQTSNQKHVNIQPSLITNQFIGQMYMSNQNRDQSLNYASSNTDPMPNRLRNENFDDDDYWSDFVSMKPSSSNSIVNNSQQKQSGSSNVNPNRKSSWSNVTTNIITNPGHFDAFQSYVPPVSDKLKSKSKVQSRSSVTSVPDLDFVAPKNRTSNRK